MLVRIPALFALMIVAACAVGSGVVVRGAGADLLKLREGPGLDQPIIIGLPDGTRLTRQGCVTVEDRLWCRVMLTDRPSVAGYVSADYLAHR